MTQNLTSRLDVSGISINISYYCHVENVAGTADPDMSGCDVVVIQQGKPICYYFQIMD